MFKLKLKLHFCSIYGEIGDYEPSFNKPKDKKDKDRKERDRETDRDRDRGRDRDRERGDR